MFKGDQKTDPVDTKMEHVPVRGKCLRQGLEGGGSGMNKGQQECYMLGKSEPGELSEMRTEWPWSTGIDRSWRAFLVL